MLPIRYRDRDRRRAAARGLRAVLARAAARATAALKSQFSAIVPPNPTGIVGPIVSP